MWTNERKESGSNGRLNDKPKDTRANSGRWTQALRMASHKKAKVRLYLTNSGNSREVPKVGAITKEQRMAAKETGWQANGGMQAQAQGQHVPGVSLPPQRDAAVVMHPHAFRRPEDRLKDQQPNPPALDLTGITAAQIEAQGQFWQQEQRQAEQAVADGDAGADQELMEDAASARQDSAQPQKAEAPTEARIALTTGPRMKEKRETSH